MSLYVVIQLALTVMALATLSVAVVGCRAPKARYAIFLAVCVCCYAAGYLMEITSADFGQAFLACRVRYVGVSFSGPFFFLFACDYCNRPLRNKALTTLLLLPGFAVCISMNLWPFSRLYYQDVWFARDSVVPHLESTPGPLYLFGAAYMYLLMLGGAAIVLHHMIVTPNVTRRNSVFLLVGICAPFVAAVLHHLHIFWNGFDFLPASLVIACTMVGIYGVLEYVPEWMSYARDVILEEMDDAYILVDKNNNYLDSNAKAEGYFPALSGIIPGMPVSDWIDLPEPQSGGGEAGMPLEMPVEVDGKVHYLHVSETPIRLDGKHICTSIMFFDVTQSQQFVQQLSMRAERDSLTGLLNHGAFVEQASMRLSQDDPSESGACLLMIDIDHFKRVNDNFGHLAGDAVLSGFARDLKQFFRDDDLCGRYGGEEFCVYMPSSTLKNAIQRAEELRRDVEAREYLYGSMSARVTISIGAACTRPKASGSVSDLIADADSALYQAKSQGRNRVCAFEVPERIRM